LALLLAAGVAVPRAAQAEWVVCWFADDHDHKLFHSPPFQGSAPEALRNQTIFEANVFMKGATTSPETTCAGSVSLAAAHARIAALERQARAAGEQLLEVPAE
jgi:hypothetical protein